ncbi:MAG: DNA polymerase IV [Sphaerochaetaceae bacterium]|nr:DNA polymerase IV [Spirochaetales bacterium]MDY5498754.1 DNA polymerase IV [Sphaerochaetaceae bacterium]
MLRPLYFHVDMDAFFASVEIHDNPSLKDKPVLIGHNERRSVVSTASYVARRYGCHSAMPMAQALRLCPQAVVVNPRFERYSQVSHQVMEICGRYSDKVQQISIDEAFLDMSGMERLYRSAKEAAMKLKAEVWEETGLTISVGIAPNRYLAKMASDYHKPDGLCRVSPGKEELFIDAVGLNKLWGIGKVGRKQLADRHIHTTQQLRSFSKIHLESMFGPSMGGFLYDVARGIDPGIFDGESKSHSISTETTFLDDVSDGEVLRQYLLSMSHELMFRCLEERQIARTVSLKLRWPDFSLHEAQVTPDENILSAEQVYRIAAGLLEERWHGTPIRLLGLGLGGLYQGEAPMQQELFSSQDAKRRKVEKVILQMQKKGQKVVKASSLVKRD